MPWHHPDLADWSIVGMNHYHVDGRRFLFVAMTRGGACIRAEGADDGALWERLRKSALFQNTPEPFDFSKRPGDGNT